MTQVSLWEPLLGRDKGPSRLAKVSAQRASADRVRQASPSVASKQSITGLTPAGFSTCPVREKAMLNSTGAAINASHVAYYRSTQAWCRASDRFTGVGSCRHLNPWVSSRAAIVLHSRRSPRWTSPSILPKSDA